MPAKRTLAVALAALLALSAGAVAGAHGDHKPDHAHEASDDHAEEEQADQADEQEAGDDKADESDEAAENASEPPEAALFGLCKAWGHHPDDGNASSAGPFAFITAPLCEDVEHPGQAPADAGSQADERRPDDAGPPWL
jgi:hypothetical protein